MSKLVNRKKSLLVLFCCLDGQMEDNYAFVVAHDPNETL